MKIDTQALLKPMQCDVNQHNQHKEFETLLNSGQHDDQYYWQHQNQLEQSALTFTLPIQMNQSKLIDNQGPSAHLLHHPESREDYPNQGVAPQNASSLTTLKMTSEQLFEFKEITTPILHHIEKIISQPEPQVDPINDHEEKTKYIKNEATAHRSTPLPFKNHQLFIDNKQVELAINTGTPSDAAISVLKIHLKKWLHNKGYLLKQLIINGVKQ